MSFAPLSELQHLITRHAPAVGAARGTMLANVTLMAAEAPTPVLAEVTEPTFAIVAHGAKRVRLGDRVFDYGVGQYLVVSVDLPLNAQVTEATIPMPYLGLGFALRPETIASLLLESGTGVARKSAPTGIAVSTLTDDLIDPVVRLLRLLDRPADIPILAPAIEREILWRLVNGAQGTMVCEIGLADSRMAQINRAIRWLRSHFAKAIRVEDLAGVAGMSATSFHRHFKSITSMTPIQYQKQLRFQAARTRLMAQATVAEVAFAVGYDSPSQFGREYRRHFGQSPGRDGRVLRRADSSALEKQRG